MKNFWIKISLTICSVLTLLILGSLITPFNCNEYMTSGSSAEVTTPATNAISKSETNGAITFTESLGADNSQMVSYFVISLNGSLNGGIEDISIKQKIGNITFDVEQDELGTSIVSSTTSSAQYYFTRTADYYVTYKYKNSETIYSTNYFFSPAINFTAVESSNTDNKIIKIDNDYYIVGNGFKEIVQPLKFNTKLYGVSFTCNGTYFSPDIDKTTNLFNWTIAENTFGRVKVEFFSGQGTASSFNVIVINNAFKTSFYEHNNFTNSGKLTTSSEDSNYSFGTLAEDSLGNIRNYFLFNDAVSLKIEVSDDCVYPIKSAGAAYASNISDSDKKDCISLVSLSIKENTRNNTNTDFVTETEYELEKEESCFKYSINVKEHSVFNVKFALEDSKRTVLNDSILCFKIITVVPINPSNNLLDFGIYLTTSNYNNNFNYILNCLNSTLVNGSPIYVNVDTTTLATSGNKLDYIITYEDNSLAGLNSSGFISSTSSNDITLVRPDSERSDLNVARNIVVRYDTRKEGKFASIKDFNSFYSFNFNLIYSGKKINSSGQIATKEFTDHIKVGKIENGTFVSAITSDYDFDFSLDYAPKIYVDEEYYESCIPVYVRVTYNNKVYDNFYTLKELSEIEFIKNGDYTLEISVFPNYEYCQTIVNEVKNTAYSAVSHYYLKFNFSIAGPSLNVVSTDINGNTFSITNYMITQNYATVYAKINEGQKVHLVNTTTNETWEFSDDIALSLYRDEELKIPMYGSWYIYITDANDNEIDSIQFTIMDEMYQAYSLNNHEEYEELLVYKKDPLTNAYVLLPTKSCYHLVDEGDYRVQIVNGEKLYFYDNSESSLTNLKSSSIEIANTVNFTIKKSFFSVTFVNGTAGGKTTEKISIESYDGVDIKLITVYRNGKAIGTYEPNAQSSNIAGTIGNLLNSDLTYSDTGIYTFVLTDRYNNTYAVQIEKYYKANVALIVLICLGVVGVFVLFYIIFKSRRGLKVK